MRLIYIDPPYNTGRQYVYADGCRNGGRPGAPGGGNGGPGQHHAPWLNMMLPRLILAHRLLARDGFLFASIDDTEVHNLRHLLDEVFGEPNFIANVIWQKKYTRANDAAFFSGTHDHILVYARCRQGAGLSPQPRTERQRSAYSNPDGHPKGPWKATPLHAKSGTDRRPYRFRNGVAWAPPAGTYRRFSDAAMEAMERNGEIWFGGDGAGTPCRKSFLAEVKPGLTPVTIWPCGEVGHNHEANNELKAALGQGVFDNPKPTRLIRRILQLATRPDRGDLVLDFFAGSGTTGAAVLAQNAADGGDRRYLLVQLPEPLDPGTKGQRTAAEFCDRLGRPRVISELTKERLRRVSRSLPEGVPRGFRVYRWEPAGSSGALPVRGPRAPSGDPRGR